jgi:flagellar biosynthesis protein FlhG
MFMLDQASDLRRMIGERARSEGPCPALRPKRIVVCGGKGGVGTTTVAIQLALANPWTSAGSLALASSLALANQEQKSLLVDADSHGGDIALRCGCDERYTVKDLLTGRRKLQDLIQRCDNGLRVVCGSHGWDALNPGCVNGLMNNTTRDGISANMASNTTQNMATNMSAMAVDRLYDAIHAGGMETGPLIIDAGNTPDRTCCRLWQTADVGVMVTTPEPSSIVGAYETVKQWTRQGSTTPVLVLVNMVKTSKLAETVYQRLADAGRRFLGAYWISAGHFAMIARHRWTENGSPWLCKDAQIAMQACRTAWQPLQTPSRVFHERITMPSPSCGNVVCGT